MLIKTHVIMNPLHVVPKQQQMESKESKEINRDQRVRPATQITPQSSQRKQEDSSWLTWWMLYCWCLHCSERQNQAGWCSDCDCDCDCDCDSDD